MDELIRQVVDILRGMWHRRWIGVAAAWVVALAGAAGLARMPDRYEATARVYVDTSSLLQPLLSGLAIQPDIEQQVGMLARTLVTRPNIEKLVSKTDLDAGAAPAEKDKLVDQIMKELRFSAAGRDNVYNVSFRDADRDHAQRIVQALVSMFVESGLGNKRRDAESTRKFIDDQIATYERRLQEAENRLKDFRLRNMSMTSASAGGQDYVARMSTANEDLSKARFELRVAEQSRDALRRELAGEEPSLLPDAASTGPIVRANPELDARIDVQKRLLDELLRRYTDEHPDVAQTKRMVASLEEQKRQEIEARRKAAAAAPPRLSAATNPVFQQIKIALTEAEANVAALSARVGEMQARAEQLRASANRVPQVEAEMAQLNRDYEIIRQSYQQMVSRREALALTGEVDESTGMAEFRIIDPPRVGDKPVFPNRMVLVPLLLVVAFGIGAAVAFLAAQLLPTIHSTRTLREVGQRPVLGSLSLRPTAAMLKRQRVSMAGFAASLAALIALYGAWLAWLAIAARP